MKTWGQLMRNKYNDFNQKKYDDQKNTFIVLKTTLALQYEI